MDAELDLDENILVTANFITDISHLGLSDEVKLTIVGRNNNTCFLAVAPQMSLDKVLPVLIKREVEILKMLVVGRSSRKIAEALVISYYTARTHRKNILEKPGKRNTAELVNYTLYNGLI
jgi:DNA-binding CsgD family transcriptional regulator